MFLIPAPFPTKVLRDPVLLKAPADAPINVFDLPVDIERPALNPTTVLFTEEVPESSAL